MKRIICIFLILLTTFEILYYLGIKEKENFETLEVFNEQNQTIYKYYVEVDNIIFTTKKVPEFFKDRTSQIIKIYPLQNLVIEDDTILKKTQFFYYSNMKNIEKSYKKILEEYGLYTDIDKINISGINIDKLLMYLTKDDIELLKRDYSNINFYKFDS